MNNKNFITTLETELENWKMRNNNAFPDINKYTVKDALDIYDFSDVNVDFDTATDREIVDVVCYIIRSLEEKYILDYAEQHGFNIENPEFVYELALHHYNKQEELLNDLQILNN